MKSFKDSSPSPHCKPPNLKRKRILAMFPQCNFMRSIAQAMSVTVQVERSESYEITDLFPAGETTGCPVFTLGRLQLMTTLWLSS